MNTVTLNADGLMVHDRNIEENEPLMFLPFKAELEDGYTLRSYFKLILRYSLLSKLSMFFPAYLKQYSECPETGCACDGMDYLELSKTVEMIGFPGEPRLEIFNSFHGISGREICELKMYKLEHILDMPIKLGKLKHIIFGDKVDIFEFDTVFTFFEFIDGIAWELSFNSGPMECKMRNEK